jgi:hypothetical protein
MNTASANADYMPHVAQWSRRRPKILLIADTSGHVVSSCPVSQDCAQPSPELLRHTGWVIYPGSEWEEEPPGEWSVAVFNDRSLSNPNEETP